MDAPSIGRIVHYVLEEDQHLPAIITSVLDDEVVNLFLFNDPEIPRRYDLERGAKRCHLDEDHHEPGTWHWPERK